MFRIKASFSACQGEILSPKCTFCNVDVLPVLGQQQQTTVTTHLQTRFPHHLSGSPLPALIKSSPSRASTSINNRGLNVSLSNLLYELHLLTNLSCTAMQDHWMRSQSPSRTVVLSLSATLAGCLSWSAIVLTLCSSVNSNVPRMMQTVITTRL